MSYRIEEIEGIGPKYAAALGQVGIRNTNGFLKLCCDRKGRAKVAGETGLSEVQLLKWANLADLMRISGIGPQFSELLEAAGVDTIRELRNRRADNLTQKLAAVHEEKKLTRAVPSKMQVDRWIEAAKKLEPVITH